MRGSLKSLLPRAITLLAAAGAVAVFIAWLIELPEWRLPTKDTPLFVAVLFKLADGFPGWIWFTWMSLGLMASTGLGACLLSCLLVLKARESLATRYLALSLAFASYAAAYFFFFMPHPFFRGHIEGFSFPARFLIDFAGYLSAFLGPHFLLRFFLCYPREITESQLFNYMLQDARSQRINASLLSISHMLFEDARSLKGRLSDASPWYGKRLAKWEQGRVARLGKERKTSYFALFFASRSALLVIGVVACLCASKDLAFLIKPSLVTPSQQFFYDGMSWIALISGYVFAFFPFFYSTEVLRVTHEHSLEDDKKKVAWIYFAVTSVAVVVFVAAFGQWFVALLLLRVFNETDTLLVPGGILFAGPMVLGLQLLVAVFLASLALSIFYRGAVDPRLASHRLTVMGLLAVIVTFLFILVERFVAAKLASVFGLSPQTGAIVAGAAVAASLAPVRSRAEALVSTAVSRILPLEWIVSGERQHLVIALSDLSGYTALSARDEKSALLLATLLQRQAETLTSKYGGRVVKSMGDAVLFAFEDSPTAVKVLLALHQGFAGAAEALGLTPLPVHSGAHAGEVTVAEDGDIYGQAVNIAARVQSAAQSAEILVSDAIEKYGVSLAETSTEAGSHKFKGVDEPIKCFRLTQAAM